MIDSDIRMTGKSLVQLLCIGFGGGWVAGCLGLGGGAIYNPALLTLGVPPMVSTATGLYLVTFSKIASVFVYFLYGELDIPYALWIGLWSTLGTLLGLVATGWYMRVSGRQSIIVWILVLIFFLSVIAIPVFGGKSLMEQHDQGFDIFAFNDICK